MILETIQQLAEDHDRKVRLLKMLNGSFQRIDWREKDHRSFMIVCGKHIFSKRGAASTSQK